MPKMTLNMPDDLMRKLSDLQGRSRSIVEDALEAGGKVVLARAKSNLNSVVGKGTKLPSRSTGELKGALGLSPVKENGGGVDIKVGFAEPHSGGMSNAMLASILEYGRHGQPAKPFMAPAKSASRNACIETIKAKIKAEVENL